MPSKGGIKNVPYNAADAMYADTLDYYPSSRYIEKNLAPEKFPKESVKAAARAARQAVDAGVLSPSLATLVLPNILVEGRPDDFGVRGGNKWEGGVNAPIGKIVKKLGLEKETVVKEDVVSDAVAQLMGRTGSMPIYKKGDVAIVPKQGETPQELEYNARLMTAVLGEKARQAKGNDNETIRRWNGQGPGAINHLDKVIEASTLLKHPKNAEILDLFQQEFMKEPVQFDPLKGKI